MEFPGHRNRDALWVAPSWHYDACPFWFTQIAYLCRQPGVIFCCMDSVAPVPLEQKLLHFDEYDFKGVKCDAVIVVLSVGIHPARSQSSEDMLYRSQCLERGS